MLNLAAVAMDKAGVIRGEFCQNLELLPESVPDLATMDWWYSQPDIWTRIRENTVAAQAAMIDFVSFVQGFEGDKILVGHPLAFDGIWIDYYLRRFTEYRVFKGPYRGGRLFRGAGLDLPSLVMGATGHDLLRCRYGQYPEPLEPETPHTHHGLDDARGHAELLGKVLEVRSSSMTGGGR